MAVGRDKRPHCAHELCQEFHVNVTSHRVSHVVPLGTSVLFQVGSALVAWLARSAQLRSTGMTGGFWVIVYA